MLARIFQLFWPAWLAVVAVAALPAPARAQAGVTGDPVRVCIAPAASIADLRDALARPDRFDCSPEQSIHGPGDFWALSEPLSVRSTDAAPLVLRATSLWQGSVTLHAIYADGRVATMAADGHGVSRNIQLGAITQFALPARDAAITRLVWKIDDSPNMRGVLLGTRIATAQQAGLSNIAMATIYAAFVGLAFALLVYNLALWGALRHDFQLAYCAMVAGLLFYAVSSSGALAWAFPGIANNDRIRVNYLMLSLSAGAALLFARCFFERAVFAGWLGWLMRGAIGIVLGMGVLFFVLAPTAINLLDRLYSLSFLAMMAVLPPILWRAWSFRSSFLWLFAIAWAAPIAMAVARAMHNLGLIEWSFWIDNSTILAMGFEALVSSVAIAYRIRLLSRERDIAVAQEAVQRRLADTDPLTGLLNRRAFLDQAIGRTGTQHLMLIDIDHFKAVNETLGHDGGDEVLRLFARALQMSVPEGGLVARLGGEEFAILAGEHAELDADAVLNRLRSARMPFDLTVTASIGMCSGTMVKEVDWKRLYRGADRALFDAKASGRNRMRRNDTMTQEAA